MDAHGIWFKYVYHCLPVEYNITLLYITIIIVLCFVISSVFESASLRFWPRLEIVALQSLAWIDSPSKWDWSWLSSQKDWRWFFLAVLVLEGPFLSLFYDEYMWWNHGTDQRATAPLFLPQAHESSTDLLRSGSRALIVEPKVQSVDAVDLTRNHLRIKETWLCLPCYFHHSKHACMTVVFTRPRSR